MTKTLDQKLNELEVENISKAIAYIDQHSVYEINKHRSWLLVFKGKLYLVKEVVRRAYEIQHKDELTNDSTKFTSLSARSKLIRKGFIVQKEIELNLKNFEMYKTNLILC